MNVHSLAEQLTAVKRDHILDAATRVFAARGFNGATIRDIARQAGIADGTIYNYFKNKDALLLGILDRINETEQRPRDLALPADANPADYLRAYVRHRFDVLETVGLEAFQVVLSELLINPNLRARYVREILEPTFAIADSATNSPPLHNRVQAALVLGCLVLRLCGETLIDKEWAAVPDLVADMIINSLGGRHAADATD